MNNEWLYESNIPTAILTKMSTEERKNFPFDMKLIDWDLCLAGFCHGIQRYFLREDHFSPESGYVQLLSKNQIEYFHDARFATKKNKNFLFKDTSVYFNAILSP